MVGYKITPMATNLQFVFYRNKANDVLVKVLLNEDEATLPIKSDEMCIRDSIYLGSLRVSDFDVFSCF